MSCRDRLPDQDTREKDNTDSLTLDERGSAWSMLKRDNFLRQDERW